MEEFFEIIRQIVNKKRTKHKDTWDVVSIETLAHVIILKATRIARGSPKSDEEAADIAAYAYKIYERFKEVKSGGVIANSSNQVTGNDD